MIQSIYSREVKKSKQTNKKKNKNEDEDDDDEDEGDSSDEGGTIIQCKLYIFYNRSNYLIFAI
jgi:hypothetical protein